MGIRSATSWSSRWSGIGHPDRVVRLESPGSTASRGQSGRRDGHQDKGLERREGRLAQDRAAPGRLGRSRGHGSLHSGRAAGVPWRDPLGCLQMLSPAGLGWKGNPQINPWKRLLISLGWNRRPALQPGTGSERVPAMPPIRMVDLRRQHRSLKQPIEAAVREVLEDCDFVMGRPWPSSRPS